VRVFFSIPIRFSIPLKLALCLLCGACSDTKEFPVVEKDLNPESPFFGKGLEEPPHLREMPEVLKEEMAEKSNPESEKQIKQPETKKT